MYCNVVNASDEVVTLKQNQVIGNLCNIESINEKFDQKVQEYVELDVGKLENSTGKTCSSVPLTLKTPKPPELTTQKIFQHQLKRDISKLKIGKHLTQIQRELLIKVLARNQSAFLWNAKEMGHTKLIEHVIPTGNSRPINTKQYPIPSVARERVQEQVDEMLENKLIRPSYSPWCSPVLLVKKKLPDGSIKYRFCIDLKKVNSVTAKDSYSLPRISETVDALSGANYFTTMDVDRAFWQVGVAEEDKQKTAFIIGGKLYEFNVMPFGSMNASSTFQRLMDRVLRGLTWKQCLVYIDDVLIFSSTFEQHLKDIDEVLARFSYAGLKLKPNKCSFADEEVEYLGFKISGKGIQITTKKTDAILNVKPPELSKNLFNFLCSINYYRTLIPNFGRITADLYQMSQAKKKTCTWTPETLKQFADLKQALVTAPILVFPNFKIPFHIQTDASQKAIGGVLLQQVKGLFKPVAFASRKLSDTERRYSATERELLALIYCYDQFNSHVYGRKIEFYTDHEPLVTMSKLKKPLGRLGRLFHRLQDVDYDIHYLPGSSNFLPDFLSRSFHEDSVKSAENNFMELKSSINWPKIQENDLEIKSIRQLIVNNTEVSEWLKIKNGRRWLTERSRLYMSDNILKHGSNKIVCTAEIIPEILALHHDSTFAGHRAFETTLVAVRNRYFWINMVNEVKNYCNSCVACQKFNYSCLHNRAPLKPLEVSRPWQLAGFDFMGPFKTSRHGNKYIILGIDHLTKFAEGAATPTFDAVTTATFIFNNIVCRYGMLEKLLTDQGVNFESNLLKHLCILMGTDKLHTSTYHPAGNGITERLNKTVKPNLAKFVNDEHDDWDLFLQMAISAYNNSYHASIKMSPFEAQFGRPPVLVADVIMNHQLPSNTRVRDIADYTIALRKSAAYIQDMVLQNSEAARIRMKTNYDRFIQDKIEFKIGDFVKIDNFRVRIGKVKSFEQKFLGPYMITRQVTALDYQLEAPNLKTEIVHYNRMHRYTVREQYLYKSGSVGETLKIAVPILKVRDDSFFMNIIQNPHLLVLKRRAINNRMIPGIIQTSVDNSCREMVLYVSPASSTVPLHTALNDVMVGRSELYISNRLRSQIRREIVRESEVAVEAIDTIPTLDFNSFDRVIGILKTGDKIAFKELTITLDFEPQISNYKVGTVQIFNQDTNEINIKLENANDDIVLFELGSLIDIRVFPTFNSKGKQTVPCPRCSKLSEKLVGLRMHSYSCRGVGEA
jgi:hypothetical protein